MLRYDPKKREKDLQEILEDERRKALFFNHMHGLPDGLTKERANELWDEEYLFLKKLRRVYDEGRGYSFSGEELSVSDETEFGRIFRLLMLRLSINHEALDVLDVGLNMYFADGVKGFEAVRRLMMIDGLQMLSKTQKIREDYYLGCLNKYRLWEG